jgi:dolichol-phosphate mannosyltransferase
MLTLLLVGQALALAVVLARLVPGARRRPPVTPVRSPGVDAAVSVIIPTLNEAARIEPCLRSLRNQNAPLAEIIVVDSDSTDGTEVVVRAAAASDPRLRVVRDPPLPHGWIGKVWALQHGLSLARGDWILGIDADVEADAGMVAAVVQAACSGGLDMVSFSPRFAGQGAGERLVHPGLLATLVYRFGAPSADPAPSRLLANGQCFLARRSLLLRHGGYESARGSFADDVLLARYYASRGARVGFLDGSRLFRVRAYRSLREMWREWGRSIDLSDATTRARQWLDILLLTLVQGVPPILLIVAATGWWNASGNVSRALVILNSILLLLRIGLLFALAPSYEKRGTMFWLSPLADPLAIVRVVLSTVRRPRRWRGRQYQPQPSEWRHFAGSSHE